MLKILTICLGNICRSPAAEGILRQKFRGAGFVEGKDFLVDSASTSNFHNGEHPDLRSVKVCEKYGIDISSLLARQLAEKDGEKFDYILGMDHSNLDHIKLILPDKYHDKVQLFDEHEVRDPYFSAFDGFEIMYQQLEKSASRWLDKLS